MQNVGTSDEIGTPGTASRDILAAKKPVKKPTAPSKAVKLATQKLSLVGKAANTKMSVVKTGKGANAKTSQFVQVTSGATAGTTVRSELLT